MKHLIGVLLVCVVVPCFSQRFEIRKGPVLTYKQIESKLDIASTEIVKPTTNVPAYTYENNTLRRSYSVHGFKDNKLVVGIWDDYLTLSSKALVGGFGYPGKESQVHIVEFISSGPKTYMFFTSRVELNNEFVLYVLELDENMVAQGTAIVVEKYDQAVKFGYELYIKESNDKKNIVIVRACITDFSVDTKKVQCKVIDKSFGEVWKKDISFKEDWRGVQISDLFLDNDKDLILHVNFAKTKIKPLLDQRKFTDGLIIYSAVTDVQKRFQIGPANGDSFGGNVEMKNNTLVMAGLNKNSGELNYYMQRLSGDKQSIETIMVAPMPAKFRSVVNNGDNELEFWVVDNIVQLDGYWAISVESKYGVGAPVNSPDAFLMAFTGQGKQQWQHIIRKKQTTAYPCLGIKCVAIGSKLFVIYNDAASNLSKKVDEKPNKTDYRQPWAITVQEIDESGTVKKYGLTGDIDFKNCVIDLRGMKEIGDHTYFSSLQDANFYRGKKHTYQNVIIQLK